MGRRADGGGDAAEGEAVRRRASRQAAPGAGAAPGTEPKTAPGTEPGTAWALWPTFMRRTLAEDEVGHRPRPARDDAGAPVA